MKTRRGPIDWAMVRVVVERDLTAVRRSKAVLLPMLLVPLLLLVVVPLLFGLSLKTIDEYDPTQILDGLPKGLSSPILALPDEEQLTVLVSGYLLAPLFLIVPMMISAVVAADTFAGEKDRRTLESLLHMPVGDRELLIGKTLASFLPSVAVSWIGFAAYVVVANSTGWSATHRIFVPTGQWLVLILWVGPAVAVLGLGLMVRISARARSSQEANQLGGAVVLPLLFLAVAQATGLLLISVGSGILVGAVIWVIGLLILGRGAAKFGRNALATKI